MEIWQMVRQGEVSIVTVFFIFSAVEIVLAVLCFLIATIKHRNQLLAIFAGLIPAFNIFALLYYIVAPKIEPENQSNG